MSATARFSTAEMLYVGTHRKAHHADPETIAHGIYRFARTGQGLEPRGCTPTAQPGWICESRDGRTLYAVNEVRELDGHPGGAVSAFARGEDGDLTLLNSAALPPMPCHCEVDESGALLLVATFGGGSVHLFELAPDGSIGAERDCHVHAGSSAHPKRQTSPHAHAVAIAPGGRFVLVPDLGTDRLEVYRLDTAAARLVPEPALSLQLPPLSGPRHVAFGKGTAYLINEMAARIDAFAWDGETGLLTPLGSTALLPDDFAGLRSGGAIALHPTLPFLYATTRSHGSSGLPSEPGLDQLCWCRIDPVSGALTLAGCVPSGGGIPRAFAFDPENGDLVVGHQCSGTLVRFRIDPATGTPGQLGDGLATPVPVCLHFSAAKIV
ncbi:lactonase family protein [Novosphingobium flavum]|uniref:Lactonase family protein n=1 Tax=Novosphingobium flavum TaxID=1778672 RepID=A0A7X1FS00_9SPHN|nr:lactonase family protein [Novosphingobium flavum]MBC2665875.1 lactonase family protein [Novosphingobium flavum]